MELSWHGILTQEGNIHQKWLSSVVNVFSECQRALQELKRLQNESRNEKTAIRWYRLGYMLRGRAKREREMWESIVNLAVIQHLPHNCSMLSSRTNVKQFFVRQKNLKHKQQDLIRTKFLATGGMGETRTHYAQFHPLATGEGMGACVTLCRAAFPIWQRLFSSSRLIISMICVTGFCKKLCLAPIPPKGRFN